MPDPRQGKIGNPASDLLPRGNVEADLLQHSDELDHRAFLHGKLQLILVACYFLLENPG